MKRGPITSRGAGTGQKADRRGCRGRRLALRTALLSCAVMVSCSGTLSCNGEPVPAVLQEIYGPPAEQLAGLPLPEAAAPQREPRCPPEMVLIDPTGLPPALRRFGVRTGFCIDRYEALLLAVGSERRISPYYAPNRKHALGAARAWEKLRRQMGSPEAQDKPLPVLPLWEQQEDFEPRATSQAGVLPNGHVSGLFAQKSCANAGKRLCLPGEWRLACGGEKGRKFPYGNRYLPNKCNVFREAHPAHILHDDASMGHADPRLNTVTVSGRALLRKTGATPECASSWQGDAIYDMVGNLDEWVDEPDGVFAGGFYARSSKDGCDWRASGHPFYYADYSTGVRCCADLRDEPAGQ